MALKIYWTIFSKSELQKIFDYYKGKAGIRISRRLIDEIIEQTEIDPEFYKWLSAK